MNHRKIALATLGSFALLAIGLGSAVALAGGHPGGVEKITICHASGLAGTTKFETLELPYPAVFGEAGHFYENGTPRAGHEEDYLGPCQTDTGTTTTETTPTETTPTETTPTETTPTETTPTETTPTSPQPERCPPGQGPYAGKDGQPGNDECCPDSNNDQVCDSSESTPTTTEQPNPVAPAQVTTASTPTSPPSTTPPAAPTTKTVPPVKPKKLTAKPQKPTKVVVKVKHAQKKKHPKLTGNPQTDKCKDLGNGTMRCKGVLVTQGNG